MFWKIEYFIRDFIKQYGPFDSILDVGSRDINGSVKRILQQESIPYCRYIGIDMVYGPNVDIVMNAHDIQGPHFLRGEFDLVTCCETLEHDNKFWETVEGMRWVLKPGGWLLVTTPSINFFRHDFPSDYYRFTDSAYRDYIFEGFEDVHIETYADKDDPCTDKPNNTILGYGRKPQ